MTAEGTLVLPGRLTWPRFCRYVLPLLLWMGLIFGMSTGAGSSAATSQGFVAVLGWIWPDVAGNLTRAQISILFFLARKAAHVIEYAVLTLLAVRAVQQDRPVWDWRAAGVAVLLALVYAAGDEWHQSFHTSRTSSARDVMVDAAGVLLALGFAWLWYRGRRDPLAEIERLGELRERGLVTEEEFRRAKARLLP